MKQIGKVIERQVNFLKNADPRFVSLVEHGANQTPFVAVKHNIGKGDQDMPKRLKLLRKGEKLAGVRKMTFQTKSFGSKEDVAKYLEENNWEDYQITKKGNIWVAEGSDVQDDDFTDVRKVKVAEGIIGYVGTPTQKAEDDADIEDVSDEDVSEEDATPQEGGEEDKAEDKPEGEEGTGEDDSEPKAAAAANVCKFDWWGAYLSGEDSLEGVLKDGMNDGVPPGFEEVMTSIYKAVSNTLKGDDDDTYKKNTIKTIGQEFSTVVYSMYEVFNGLSTSVEEKSENQKKFMDSYENFITKHVSVEDEDNTKTKSTKQSDSGSINSEILSKLTETMDKINSKLDSVTKTAEEAKASVEKHNKKAPTKKAVDVDANSSPVSAAKAAAIKKEQEKDAAFKKRMTANILGLNYNDSGSNSALN